MTPEIWGDFVYSGLIESSFKLVDKMKQFALEYDAKK